MDDFLTWYRQKETELHPLALAALAHQKFVFIHPFVDGNGRVARLLMNLVLLRFGYPVTIIPPILRLEYIAALEKAHTDTSDFIRFIIARETETFRELLRLLGDIPEEPETAALSAGAGQRPICQIMVCEVSSYCDAIATPHQQPAFERPPWSVISGGMYFCQRFNLLRGRLSEIFAELQIMDITCRLKTFHIRRNYGIIKNLSLNNSKFSINYNRCGKV